MSKKFKLTADEVENIVNGFLAEDSGTRVYKVELPSGGTRTLFIYFNGQSYMDTLQKIQKAFGDDSALVDAVIIEGDCYLFVCIIPDERFWIKEGGAQ